MRAFIILPGVVLVGCSGQAKVSDPTSAPSASASPVAVRYVPLGDSYTIGTSVSVGERFPNQLVERLAGQGIDVELVANLGVNGYTSADLTDDELPELAELEPDFVTLLIGVNDVVQGVPSNTYRANVQQILGALLSRLERERIVVVSTPDYTRTPRGADFGNPELQRAGIATVNSIMAEEARARGIAFVDISSVANEAGADPSLVASDLLHPSGVQYGRWVDLIEPVAVDLLADQ